MHDNFDPLRPLKEIKFQPVRDKSGMTKEVSFEAVKGPIQYRIDDAYRAKYIQPISPSDDRPTCSRSHRQGRSERGLIVGQTGPSPSERCGSHFWIRRKPNRLV
jgi:hypothetical protein